MQEANKSDVVLVEIVGTFTNKFGRKIEPTYLSVFRLTREYADELVSQGVANILPLHNECLRDELNRRRKIMQSKQVPV